MKLFGKTATQEETSRLSRSSPAHGGVKREAAAGRCYYLLRWRRAEDDDDDVGSLQAKSLITTLLEVAPRGCG